MEPGLPVPVVITAYADKSFTFILKTTPASVLIKKLAGLSKGSAQPHVDKVGKLTRSQAEEIAKIKWLILLLQIWMQLSGQLPVVPGVWVWKSMGYDMAKTSKRYREIVQKLTVVSCTRWLMH